MEPNVVKLPGKGNYALIIPGQIVYGLEVSSPDELSQLVKEVSLTGLMAKPEIKSKVSEIGLIPTFGCNLYCVYCYARGGESWEVLEDAVVRKVLDDIRKTEGHDKLKIDLLGGGEPLLNLGWVKRAETYAKTLFREVNFSVVTNGTFGTQTLDWIAATKAEIQISYDGVMQELQRPYQNGSSSKKKVQENIRKVASMGVPLSVSCVVTARGINTLRQTLDELLSMGVKTVEFEAARGTTMSRKTDWTEPNPIQFADALLDVISYACSLDKGIEINTGYFSIPGVDEGYCGISGRSRVITPHGLVTACLEVSRPADPYADKVIYGKVDNDRIVIEAEKKAFLKNFDNLAGRGGCLGCNLRMLCQGGCPLAGVWEKGLPVRKSTYTCTLEHYFLPRLLLMMAENPDVAAVVANNVEI